MEKKIKKAAEQAAASLWIDKLPLSETYVKRYIEKQLASRKTSRYSLVLKKGDNKNAK